MSQSQLSPMMQNLMGSGQMPKQVKSLIGAGLACMIIGGGLVALAFNLYTPIDQLYAALGIAAGFLLWCVVVFLIRRKSDRLPLVFALVVYVMGFGPGIVCAGGMFLVNGALDPNELVDARVEIVDKWVSGTGSSSSNHVRVSDWREGQQGKTAEFQLFQPSLFRRLEKGDQVILRVGPGLLGWWYKGMQAVPAETGS